MPLHEIRRFLPIVLPFAIVAGAWALFINPASSAAARESARLQDLRARLAAPHAPADAFDDALTESDPAAIFDRQVSSGDATAELLARLTRVALDAGATNLFIDSTTAPLPVPEGSGPSVPGRDEPDPRMALFATPLQYSAIPMSFEAAYTELGGFLWHLHDLPALVEIRSMTVKPRGSGEEGGTLEHAGAAYDGRVSVSLALFVYSRRAAGAGSGTFDGDKR